MKPSFTNQKNPPATDQKFRPQDEHVLAENKEEIANLVPENKEEVAKINQGDKLEPGHGQDGARN